MWLFRIHRCICSILNEWYFFPTRNNHHFWSFPYNSDFMLILWFLSLMLIVIRQGQFSNIFPWWKSYINAMHREAERWQEEWIKRDQVVKRNIEKKGGSKKNMENYYKLQFHRMSSIPFTIRSFVIVIRPKRLTYFVSTIRKRKIFFPFLTSLH